MRPGSADGLAYRLLAAAVSRMPPDRRDWGEAMLAELGQLRSRRARWQFLLGAARVALLPPSSNPPGSNPPGWHRLGWHRLPAAASGAVAAAATGAAVHFLAPAAGVGAAVLLSVLSAGAAWNLAAARARAGRWSRVPAAHFAVLAGLAACLALVLATIQRYPAALGSGALAYWCWLMFAAVVAASYLVLAWWLPRLLRPVRRNHLYALTAGVAVAVPAASYIAHPSLPGLTAGPFPGGLAWLVAILAPLGAAFLASGGRGRLEDGMETAAWAALLSGLTMSVMVLAATYRVLPAAGASRQLLAEAHRHGAVSAAAWLASDNLGAAIIALIWLPAIAFCLANFGVTLGCGWAPPSTRGLPAPGPAAPGPAGGRRPPRNRPGSQVSRPRGAVTGTG